VSTGSYSDFFVALGHIESGDNYSFVSNPGYLGYYQFSETALQAIGFYNGDSTPALDFSGSWSALAQSYGIHDKASFLASSVGQDAAATLWFQKVDADINTLGLGKYEGQTLNGVQITASGLLAGAHLVGVWALKTYLESGGLNVPADGNGEPISDYIQRFAGYDTPFTFDHSGNDTLTAVSGYNYLRGGDGQDSLQGGSGFDDINGNAGNDTVDGGSGGSDWLVGGQGNDLITAHAGQNILYGNLGDDTLQGGSGGDLMRGGQGDDVIVGGIGNDWISGDRGHDTLTGGAGADTFHGFSGMGIDVVTDFNVAQSDHVQLDPGTAYTVSQVGADVHVDMTGGGELVLQNTQLSSLPSGWIFGS
jgi:Ca2+-binding RTX toxin-like protein